MARKCFLSFDYDRDNWRVQQVKNMGAVEEQPLLDGNKWEEVKRRGDAAIATWIDSTMRGKECLVVLVGERTAARRWVKYEIRSAWSKGMGLMAIHIHKLQDREKRQSPKGSDPFAGISVDGVAVTGKVYDPPFSDSADVYRHIAANIDGWVETAIKSR